MTNNNVTTTNLSKQQRRALDPYFIKLAANDLVKTQLYKYQDMSEHEVRDAAAKEKVEEIQCGATASDEAQAAYDAAYDAAYAAAKYDDFEPPQKRVILPFATVRANTDTEELGGYKIHEYERYGKSFVEFSERAKVGRHTERVVYYWLAKAGVVANLEPLILDGDTSKKAPDIKVRAAKPDDNGDYQWYSLEVKTTRLEHEMYSDDPATFPQSIIVDSAKPYDQKRYACSRKDEKLIGVVKVHSLTGGVLFIPDSTRDSWDIKKQKNYWKEDTVYWANNSCLRSFALLVEKLGGKL
jgi:hypothetical protein